MTENNVEIELLVPEPAMAGAASIDLRAATQTYVAGMLHDLALPGSPDIAVRRAPALPAPQPFALYIEGNAASVRFLAQRPTPDDLTALVLWSVHANRELLASPGVCAALRAAPGTPFCPDHWSDDEARRLLRLLIRRGTRVDRRPAVPVDSSPGVWRVERQFEAITNLEDASCIAVQAGDTCFEVLRDDDQLGKLDDKLFYRLGALVPPATVARRAGLGADELRVRLNNLRLPVLHGLPPELRLVQAPPDELAALGIDGEAFALPDTGQPCTLIGDRPEAVSRCTQRWAVLDGRRFAVARVTHAALAHAGELICPASMQCSLELLREAQPDLVRGAADILDSTLMMALARELLREQVSLLDLRSVLESLLAVPDWTTARGGVEAHTAAREVDYFAENVRANLKRELCHRHATHGNHLKAHLFDSQLDTLLAAGPQQALTKARRTAVLTACWDALAERVRHGERTLVLTTRRARRPLQRLLSGAMPSVVCLAYDELDPSFNIEALGRIEVH